MKHIKKKQHVNSKFTALLITGVAMGGLMIAGITTVINNTRAPQLNEPYEPEGFNSSTLITSSSDNGINTAHIGKAVDTVNTVSTVVESTGVVYAYEEGSEFKLYTPEIQTELYRQYAAFEGKLPDYEMVLSLCIMQSNLNPTTLTYNRDGSYNFGISQINSSTLTDCKLKGWYDPEKDDIRDYDVQIRLTLNILNELCESCPGGDWDDYRAFRAYFYGVDGLREKEANGEFGSEEMWYETNDGEWYPGFYGQLKTIESRLKKTDLQVYHNVDNTTE